MFTQVLVQVVKILLGKMCIKPIHIKPISPKKVNKLLKWLLVKMCVSVLVKICGNWKDVLATKRDNANLCCDVYN